MKKVFKSIGATVGYLAVYFLTTLLVVFAAMLFFTFKTVFQAFNTIRPFQPGSFQDFLSDNTMLFMIISGILTLLCFMLIIKLGRKQIKARLELVPVSFKKLWPILPLGFTLNLIISYVLDFLPIPEKLLQEYSQSSGFLNGGNFITLFISVVIVAPIVEEVMLRGLIMRSLQNSMPLVLSLILQSLIFGLLHGQIIWIAYASVLGIILGLLKIRYQSLYACLLLHIAFNGSSLLLGPLTLLMGDSLFLIIPVFAAAVIFTVLLAILIMKATKNTQKPQEENSIDPAPVV